MADTSALSVHLTFDMEAGVYHVEVIGSERGRICLAVARKMTLGSTIHDVRRFVDQLLMNWARPELAFDAELTEDLIP